METRLEVRIVGNYSIPTADQTDCKHCHNADYGDALIEGICGRCLIEIYLVAPDLLVALEGNAALLDSLRPYFNKMIADDVRTAVSPGVILMRIDEEVNAANAIISKAKNECACWSSKDGKFHIVCDLHREKEAPK
jgi:hypothetical protein